MAGGFKLSHGIVIILVVGAIFQIMAVGYIAYTFRIFGNNNNDVANVPVANKGMNAMKQVKEIAKQQNKRLLDKQQDNHKSQHIGKTNNKNNEKKKGNGWSNLFNHMPKVPKLPFKAKLPEDASFDVFLGIMSKEGEEDKRAAIRSTMVARYGKKNWKYMFFVAKPKGFLIQSEIEKYKDIVIVDVEETYREEPKVVMGLLKTALTAYKTKPRWVVKSDSTTYINIDDLLSNLNNGVKKYAKNFYGGSPVVGNKPIRDKNSQFYESREDIPTDTFAPYNSQRGGYIFSGDLAACMIEKVAAKKVKILHNQDVAMSIIALACNAKPTLFTNHLSIMFPDMVDRKKMQNQDKKAKELSDMLPYQWNKRAAELVGQVRKNIPDQRSQQCKSNFHDASKIHLDTSIIITFVEEQPTVFVRTLRTILLNTPAKLLKEIILVDDGSSQKWLNQPYPLSIHPSYPQGGPIALKQDKFINYIKKISPKIKYVRQEREGFIRGRVKGIQLATSETFTVMESHAEVCKGWLEPLLWEIQVNPKTMANPVIVQIHFHSFAFLNPVYQMMDYNYLFEMKWGTLTGEKARTKTYKPYNSPVHAGGIYTMKKSYYNSLLGYDKAMKGFSSENLDLAFQVWMCNGGGRNIVVPCAHVGHVFRDKSPAVSLAIFTAHNVNTNKKILIDSWLPKGLPLRDEVLKERGHDLDNFKLDHPEDIPRRQKWIKDHCVGWDWFFKHVGKPTHNK